jgi:uncharacterized protein YcaQ
MTKLTWKTAAAWRMQRHHLDRLAPASAMLDVAGRVCGLHAQVMSSAGLSLWARVDGLRAADVPRALWEDRSLIKTWAMRGTLHLLPAKEWPLWRAALSTSRRYRSPTRWRRLLGITLDELDRLTEAIGAALDDRILTREELMREAGQLAALRALNEKIGLNGWGTVLKPAAMSGRLCFAPGVGQRVRFTHPNTWLAEATCDAHDAVDLRSATAELTRRYLAAYGPATDHDFRRWWGGASMATIRQWIADLGEDAVQVDLEGTKAWILAGHARRVRDLGGSRWVRLLPAFDPYVIGASRHAEHLIAGGARSAIYRPQGWVSPVLLVNGKMQGTWRHEIKGSRIEISIEPFAKPQTWIRRAAELEAERLGVFLGGTAQLTWNAGRS